jgi:hypothetical protein
MLEGESWASVMSSVTVLEEDEKGRKQAKTAENPESRQSPETEDVSKRTKKRENSGAPRTDRGARWQGRE